MYDIDDIEVITVNTYRSDNNVNQSADRARVVLDLKFPKDIALFKKLRSQIKYKKR
jgi:hypothetical protein